MYRRGCPSQVKGVGLRTPRTPIYFLFFANIDLRGCRDLVGFRISRWEASSLNILVVAGVVDPETISRVIDAGDYLALYLGPIVRFIDRFKRNAIDFLRRNTVSVALGFYDVGLYRYINGLGGRVLWKHAGLCVGDSLIINLGKKTSTSQLYSIGAYIGEHRRDIRNLVLIADSPSYQAIYRSIVTARLVRDMNIYIIYLAPFGWATGIDVYHPIHLIEMYSERSSLLSIDSRCGSYVFSGERYGYTYMCVRKAN